ncbi:hypothetical protein [Idiomarina abyssalis]|uniref:Uncharacterized protein n=1 Tax=Idiomarina abyssalis TaxID=86102 RepID=A0A8I1KK79_9GAMM|nr:hypothetical protein [Idiomarina abyssalis]MBJ7265462.1 hypothetical protein [Idiomarina abyssalis]MBJ7316864.1 hypothetical protein [Idiomarina abyssalis]
MSTDFNIFDDEVDIKRTTSNDVKLDANMVSDNTHDDITDDALEVTRAKKRQQKKRANANQDKLNVAKDLLEKAATDTQDTSSEIKVDKYESESPNVLSTLTQTKNALNSRIKLAGKPKDVATQLSQWLQQDIQIDMQDVPGTYPKQVRYRYYLAAHAKRIPLCHIEFEGDGLKFGGKLVFQFIEQHLIDTQQETVDFRFNVLAYLMGELGLGELIYHNRRLAFYEYQRAIIVPINFPIFSIQIHDQDVVYQSRPPA